MNGLARHERDAGLLARAGAAGLCVPGTDELRGLLRRALLREDAPDPRELRWEYARWKPGQSLCLGWELEFEPGRRAWIGWKRYQDGRGRRLESRAPAAPEAGADALFARGRAALDESTWIFAYPFDRRLPGLPRALDLQRRARELRELEGAALPRLRWRRAQALLLRYKPERRAVLRLEWPAEAPLAHALRVLTPREAARCLAARRSFAFARAPRWIGARAQHGLLYEEWLELDPLRPTEAEAAALLAELHDCSLPEGVPACPRPAAQAELAALFELDPQLSELARTIPLDEPEGAQAWSHGDFHIDQLGRSARGPVLLDLDSLGRAAPARDLSSWIADRFLPDERPPTPAEACDPVVEAYVRAGGRAPDARELRAAVAAELVRRAAAGLRRLEAGAPARARRLLEQARACGAARSCAPTGLQRALAALGPLERCDLDERGGATLMLARPGPARWFRAGGDGLEELRLREDARLPGAAQAQELIEGGAAELVSWRPGRRFVLRLETRVRKGLRASRHEAALRRQEQVWSASQGRSFRVARVLASDTAQATFDLERLPGRALDYASADAAALARLLEDWRSIELPGLAPHRRSDELELLGRLAERHARAAGSLPAGWESSCEALESEFEDGPRLVSAHRDLYEAQILAGAGPLGLLDFDLACLAEPELDPANLLAHLELARIRGQLEPAAAAEFERAFLAACAGLSDSALRFFRVASLLRLALVWRLRRHGAEAARELVARAESLLDA